MVNPRVQTLRIPALDPVAGLVADPAADPVVNPIAVAGIPVNLANPTVRVQTLVSPVAFPTAVKIVA